jgi:hypothetical protein
VQTFLVPVMGIYDVLAISFVATYIDEGGAWPTMADVLGAAIVLAFPKGHGWNPY